MTPDRLSPQKQQRKAKARPKADPYVLPTASKGARPNRTSYNMGTARGLKAYANAQDKYTNYLHNGYHRSFDVDKKAVIKAIEQKSTEAQTKSVSSVPTPPL